MVHARIGMTVAAVLALACSTAAPAGEVRAVQYFHPGFYHYFMTANPVEIAALDARVSIESGHPASWARTGLRMIVLDAPGPGTVPVCRFFTDRFAGKASHFFTASAAECEWVKANPDWTFEGIAFHAWPASTEGECPVGMIPVWRYFSGASGSPNHAYVVDTNQAKMLMAWDFIPEGVAFCVPTSAGDAVDRTSKLAATSWTFPAFPEIYDDQPFRFSFPANVSQGRNSKLNYLGMQTAYYLYLPLTEAWTSDTAWDPLSNGYVLVGGSGFEGATVAAIAYLFDNVDDATAPVCSHAIYSLTDGFTGPLYQPFVWSGCRAGTITRR